MKVDISKKYKEGDIDISWSCDGFGFGHLSFKKLINGEIVCGNECMDKKFIKKVLCALADQARLLE